MAWAPDYVTLAECKDYVRIDDTQDDVAIAMAITAASRAVDRSCNRQFGKSATLETRYYTAKFDRKRCRWMVEIDDLMTTVGLVVAYTDLMGEIDSLSLKPVNAAAEGQPWTNLIVNRDSAVTPGGIEDGIEVTATFGWTAVPVPIKQATAMQASRFLSRRDSPFGVAGSPEAGNEIRLLPKLDPDVALTVRSYYRWWGAA